MAIKKQVDISVDAKQAISQMDELGSSFEDVFGEIKPLNTKIGEMEDALYQLAQAGDTSSKEFKDLSRTIGDYKKVIIDTDMQVDAMAQTTAQNMGGAIEGVSGAFAIGTGAMGAFGVESEAVGEALLRVQSAMAITQGIQSIREGAKAFRGMKAAIMASSIAQKILSGVTIAFTVVQRALNAAFTANPIGLIVVAVAALVAGIIALIGPVKDLINSFSGVSDSAEKVSEDMERVNGVMEKHNKLIDETIKKSKKRREQDTKSLKLQGASEEELHQNKLKNLKIDENNRKFVLKDIAKQNKIQYDLLARARKQGSEEDAETIKTTIQANRDKYKELKLLDGDYALTVKEAGEVERKRIEAENKERRSRGRQRAADRKAAAQANLDTEREIEDAILANKEESEAKEQEMNMIAFKRFREDTLANTSITEKQKQDLIDAAAEKGRLKRIEIGEKYKAIDEQAIADAKLADEEKAALDLETLTARLDAESEVKKAALEKQVEDNKKAEELKREQQEATAELSKQALQGIGDIANLVFDSQLAKAEGNEKEQDKIRRKAFNMNKAMQLGIATIQGVQAVQNAFATASASPITLLNPAYPFIQAGAAGLFSAINIAKIAAAKYQGGSPGSVTPPSGGGGGVPTPQFNVVGAGSANQLAQSLGEGQNQPIQAFVVAGDVTSAQSLERNAIKTASL